MWPLINFPHSSNFPLLTHIWASLTGIGDLSEGGEGQGEEEGEDMKLDRVDIGEVLMEGVVGGNIHACENISMFTCVKFLKNKKV